jgi:hypothetical protein
MSKRSKERVTKLGDHRAAIIALWIIVPLHAASAWKG